MSNLSSNRKKSQRYRLLVYGVLACGIAFSGFLYWRTLRSYREGNFFELLRYVPLEAAPSRTIKIRKETLNGDWTRIVELNSAAVVWKTTAQFPIQSGLSPVLVCNNLRFQFQGDVFQKDNIAGTWTSYGRQVYATLPPDQNPSCAIEYTPEQPKLLSRRQEQFGRESVQDSFQSGTRQISLLRTHYSLLPCKEGISIRNGRDSLTASSNLLNESQPSGRWTYQQPAEFTLFDGGPKKPIWMHTDGDVYASTRYYDAGVVLWRFVAAAWLDGRGLPRLVIFADDKRIATLRIRSQGYGYYEAQAFMQKGFHTVRAEFVNDLRDREIKADRNISISKIAVEYTGSILLTGESNALSGFDINYCTADMVQPKSATAEVAGYVRKSIIMPPSSSVSFHLRLPRAPRLIFAVTPMASRKRESNAEQELTIRVKPLLGQAAVIFSYKLPLKGEWREQDVDLKAYSNRPVTLQFESKTANKFAVDARDFALSNPIIVSDQQFPQKKPQHIFIITADALRADHVGCYGYGRPTSPAIDLFSMDAVLFENAFSQGTATLTSTASLFTSVYPSEHKTDWNTSKLPGTFLTLPQILTANGYLSAGFVQNEFLNPPHGLTTGFQWYLYDRFGLRTEERIKPALKWIQEMKNFPQFVFFHMLHPHSPYIPPPEIAKLFHVSPMPLASSNTKLIEMDQKRIPITKDERQQLIGLFDAEIRHLDVLFAEFINHLKTLGIYDDALIIFLSDHGEAFQEHGRWGHGSTVYQEMIHVPLIIKFPKSYKKEGLRISEYVQTMDLMPTILELCNFPQPDYLRGKSLLPLVRGNSDAGGRFVFSEDLGDGHLLAVMKDGMKYIFTEQTQKEELYDLRTDSTEIEDLSQNRPDLIPVFRNARSAYLQRALEWRKKYFGTNDGEHIVLDENQTEELKALGYIQ